MALINRSMRGWLTEAETGTYLDSDSDKMAAQRSRPKSEEFKQSGRNGKQSASMEDRKSVAPSNFEHSLCLQLTVETFY